MNIALVIIDMQNDFVLPEAPLCVKGAQATVPTIRELLDRARTEGWRVIHVIRQHRRDGSDVEIGRAPLFTQDFHVYRIPLHRLPGDKNRHRSQ